MPDITSHTKPNGPRTASDLENKVEQILLRLAVPTEAASALLRHYGDDDSENLAPEVASIIGNAVLDSFETTYGELIALARVTVGDAASVSPVGADPNKPRK